jgi:hypothetical protein
MLDSVEMATVVQQIYYISSRSPREYDGHTWAYYTFEGLRQHAGLWFISERSLQRHVARLEDLGILVSAHLERNSYNRRKSYRIDQDHLTAMVAQFKRDNPGIPDTTYESDESEARPAQEPAGASYSEPVAPDAAPGWHDEILPDWRNDSKKNYQENHVNTTYLRPDEQPDEQPDESPEATEIATEVEPSRLSDRQDSEENAEHEPQETHARQKHMFKRAAPASQKSRNPRPPSRQPSPKTQLMSAYTAAVSGRGWMMKRSDAGVHLATLADNGCRPEDVEQVIVWATEGQKNRRAYHLQHLADDFLSWKGAQAKQQQTAGPPAPALAPEPDDGEMTEAERENRRMMEIMFPGYFDDQFPF